MHKPIKLTVSPTADHAGRAGLMVRALDSVSSGPGPGPGRGYCCVLGEDTFL